MPTSTTGVPLTAANPQHRAADGATTRCSGRRVAGLRAPSETARIVVDLPNEPTTATTRVRRATVRRYSAAAREVSGQSRKWDAFAKLHRVPPG